MPVYRFFSFNARPGQSAIEYLLLLALVAVIVLVGFNTFVPKTQEYSLQYFNAVSRGVMGDPLSAGSPGKLRTTAVNYP
jgi:hypothetical protein